MYIKRNKHGHIEALSEEKSLDFSELASDQDLEFVEFLKYKVTQKSDAISSLEETDTELVRVLEDVIEILISKNLLQFTDLPKAARDKLAKRHSLRKTHQSLQLLDDPDDDDSFKNL